MLDLRMLRMSFLHSLFLRKCVPTNKIRELSVVRMCFDTVAGAARPTSNRRRLLSSKMIFTSLRKTGERGHRNLHMHVLQCVHWIYGWQSASTLLTLSCQKLIMHFNWLGTTRCLAEQMGGCTSPRHEIVKAGIKKKVCAKETGDICI